MKQVRIKFREELWGFILDLFATKSVSIMFMNIISMFFDKSRHIFQSTLWSESTNKLINVEGPKNLPPPPPKFTPGIFKSAWTSF